MAIDFLSQSRRGRVSGEEQRRHALQRCVLDLVLGRLVRWRAAQRLPGAQGVAGEKDVDEAGRCFHS